MRGIYPWLYVDYNEKLWKFYVDEKSDLYYTIMYREGKWTKESFIDSRITGFGLFIDNNEGIHLIYSNLRGELKYCTLKENKWLGKVLYKSDNENYSIESIKIEILGPVMHIFFALSSKDGSDHGILMHCIWDGNKISVSKLEDIILKSELKDYYIVNINDKNEIYLFYLSDEGDELSLNYSIYRNNNWIPSNRLYGIQGEEVYFEVQLDDNIHILNKSKENSTYYLDHVVINPINGYESFNVYSGKNNVKDPLIFKDRNKIYSCWIEDNNIYYSTFNIMKWSTPKKFIIENTDMVERYNAFISDVKLETVREVKLYGTIGMDLYLYHPKDFILENNDENNYHIEERENSREYENSLKNDLHKLKEENNLLEGKVHHLNLLVEKNHQAIEKYKQQISKLLDQKRKAEENSNIFLELQKKIQSDYDNLNKDFSALKEEKTNIESNLKKEINNLSSNKSYREKKLDEEYRNVIKKINTLEEEKVALQVQIKENISEINFLKSELSNLSNNLKVGNSNIEDNKKIISNLEDKNKILIEENESIKEKLISLKEENKKLSEDLEVERNQSVMERFLRRRN